jgi:hypothetical protein
MEGRFDHSLYIVRDEKQQVTKVAVYHITRKQMGPSCNEPRRNTEDLGNATEGFASRPSTGASSASARRLRTHAYDSPDELIW